MEKLLIVNDLDKKRIIKQISNEEGLSNYKVIGYQEFIKKFYFDYDAETIYYVTEKLNTTKEIAQMYLKNLYFLKETQTKSDKIKFLKELYKDLQEQSLLITNTLWKNNLKKQTIIFYHIAKKDKFFKNMIKECQKITNVQEIDFQLLNNQTINITEYKDVESEVIGICNNIGKLIKQGINPNQIYLTNLSENYRNYFVTYSSIFHIPFSLKTEESNISNNIVTEFLSIYKKGIKTAIEELTVKYTKPEEVEILKQIIDICNRYPFIKEEEKRQEFIMADLQKSTKKKRNISCAVHEIDFQTEELDNDSILFVLGANEGKFSLLKKDEQFLSDKERIELGLETTNELNELEKNIYETKLRTFPKVYISYAKMDGKLELYQSSVLEKLECTKETICAEEFNHSHLYNELSLAIKKDILRKYGTRHPSLSKLQTTYPNQKYNQYQNDFHSFPREKQPINLSYTTLDTFFHCAFRYYLDQVLKLNIYEDSFNKKIGTLFHQILKEFYEPNFDFEKSWDTNTKELQITSEKESFFLSKLQTDLERILETLKQQEEGKGFQVLTEQKLEIPIINQEVSLKGFLDKVMFKKEDNQTLVSIIDYKTGNPNLNLDYIVYGLNLQLPIYLLLIKKLPFENIKPIGFYLQKILPSIPESDGIHTEEELKQKKLMLQGYSTDEESILKIFDPTYENSKLISGLKTSSKGFYAYSKILSEENFKKIEEIVSSKIKEATEDIIQNKFEINPKRIGNKLVGCDYCKYQSICYRKEENINNLKEIKLIDILGGEKNANMDT